jgi:hypothetical protein
MNPPLYSILRKNPAAFLAAFERLESNQQEVAAASQFDFNLPLAQQQFSADAIAALPESLRPVAAKFNTLIASAAK